MRLWRLLPLIAACGDDALVQPPAPTVVQPNPAPPRMAPAPAPPPPCITSASSTIPGVSLRFVEPSCRFSLDEALAGVPMPYEIVVDEAIQVTQQDSCVHDSGLVVRTSVEGDDNQAGSGGCPSWHSEATLVPGTYRVDDEFLAWSGFQSDTAVPSAPMHPGRVRLTVTAFALVDGTPQTASASLDIELGAPDPYVGALDPPAGIAWARRHGVPPFRGGAYPGRGRSLAEDGRGNLYVAGMASAGGRPFPFAAKLAPDGRLVWYRNYLHGSGWASLAVDDAGNLVVAGGGLLGEVRKYDPDGHPLWQVYAAGGQSDVAITPGGDALLATRSGLLLLAGDTGETRWSLPEPAEEPRLALDGTGRILVYGRNAASRALAPDGALLWTRPDTARSAAGMAEGFQILEGPGRVRVAGDGAELERESVGTDTQSLAVAADGSLVYAGVTGARLWVRTTAGTRELGSSASWYLGWNAAPVVLASRAGPVVTGELDQVAWLGRLAP